MARLAGSPVPVPTTFRSTSGARALKPGPSTLLLTSTTFTSAPMATLSRVWAAAGVARARTVASTATNRSSMANLLFRETESGGGWAAEHSKPAGRHTELHPAGGHRERPIGEEHGLAHPHVVAIVRAEEQALFEHTVEGRAAARLRRALE